VVGYGNVVPAEARGPAAELLRQPEHLGSRSRERRRMRHTANKRRHYLLVEGTRKPDPMDKRPHETESTRAYGSSTG
jgi:hypothetical protein